MMIVLLYFTSNNIPEKHSRGLGFFLKDLILLGVMPL